MEEPKQIEEPSKKEKPIQYNILEYSTIIYAFLTFLAYSYIDSYYAQWGIDIYSYLDASEILLIFLAIFKTSILFLIVITILLIIIVLINSIKFKIISNHNHFLLKVTPSILYILLLSTSLVYAVYQSLKNNYHVIALVSFIGVIVIYNFLNKRLNILMRGFKLNNNMVIGRIAILALLSMFIVSSSSIYKYQKISNLYTKTSFCFNYESTTYKSNDTLLYIGATSKYIFLRNTKDSTNLIFDKSTIKNLSITKKRNTNK